MTNLLTPSLKLLAERVGRASGRMAVRLVRAESGQDLIEYALMAGMVAVAVAATFPTGLMPAVSTVYSKIQSTVSVAASQGG